MSRAAHRGDFRLEFVIDRRRSRRNILGFGDLIVRATRPLLIFIAGAVFLVVFPLCLWLTDPIFGERFWVISALIGIYAGSAVFAFADRIGLTRDQSHSGDVLFQDESHDHDSDE